MFPYGRKLLGVLFVLGVGLGVSHAQDESLETALKLAQGGVESNTAWLEHYPNGFETTFDDGVPMMLVPAGCYEMGNDDRAFFWTGGQWQQGVPSGGELCFETPFWVDKYEVNVEQFSRLNGVAKRNNYFDGDQRPRGNVTWFEANNFCAQRSELTGALVRLPTEAEWEYSARGVDSWEYPWGNDWNSANAIWKRGYDLATADVGSLPNGTSWVGAFDMSGNMWEWTLNLYLDYPYPPKAEEDAWLALDNTVERRVLRGGSWNNSFEDELRSAYRLWGFPDYPNLAIGFRCVRLAP